MFWLCDLCLADLIIQVIVLIIPMIHHALLRIMIMFGIVGAVLLSLHSSVQPSAKLIFVSRLSVAREYV
jgi:hypothetical protein